MYRLIMKQTVVPFMLATLLSCSVKTDSDNVKEVETSQNSGTKLSSVPPDGTYRYDMAFAEWDGLSMGEKVTVIIKGDSVKVVYEGDGALAAEKGATLDSGRVLRHKSNVWIIAHHEHDVNLEEIGGCTDGPRIIDFEGKKFWTC